MGVPAVFGNLGNLADLMKNAGKIREQMEQAAEQLGGLRVEGEAGGSVKAVVNGRLELISVRIDPKLAAGGDVELMEDLVTAAVNQAMGRAREEAARAMTGGMGLDMPGLDSLFPGGGRP
ncbi:YbaB/EbfC family nucleoid-associated protein [Tautonia plasticadhaerens]|uniref:Nucleoid-associated protein ElP_07550 n=1 Tax=Tautonia plasticadhaerens TaxID=2527974 RepID=A0A518GWF0_9BACT|nr:YbaB/EbfC family nucleoid-associated protein [Tautonia plasticadhaerens]QDV32915.1 Nucleoid-associated protein [Tautonia plasticadhaerens]